MIPLFKVSPSPSWNFRLALACFVAVSVSLPIAWISLSKVVLFITGLIYATKNLAQGETSEVGSTAIWTNKYILFIVFLFGVSLLWTSADSASALHTLVKHSKILDIVLLVYLIRSATDARRVVGVFLTAQVAVLIISWFVAAGMPFPWGAFNANTAGTRYVIFAESYIDQSLMFCVLAAVAWHIDPPILNSRWIAGAIALAALGNVFFLLPGRTGYVVGIAVISLTVMWAAPRQHRVWVVMGVPLLLLSALYLANEQSHQRLQQLVTETHQYSEQQEMLSSSGWRLNAWRRSLQAIKEQPAIGYGVGGWALAAKSFEGSNADAIFGSGNNSNPHQEFLLWGVELGVGGSLLLLGLLLCMARDAMAFPPPARKCMHSILAVVGIACLFNSALYDDLIGDYLCVAMGILYAYGIRHCALSRRTHTG